MTTPPEPSPSVKIAQLVCIIAEKNPYRILGVYSNSSKREQLANVSRMSAFLRVKKPISFPGDCIGQLVPLVRTEYMVNRANASIDLPFQRLSHALFWFFKVTPEDDNALADLIDLIAQGADNVVENIWFGLDGVSVHHNLALCYFLSGKGEKAIPLLEQLYAEHSFELGQLVDKSLAPTEAELVDLFLSTVKDEAPDQVGLFAPYVSRASWKDKLGSLESERLMQFIKDCDGQKGATAEERLETIQGLEQKALPVLETLKLLMGEENPTYANLADQVATKILQGVIYYYNHQEETPDVVSVTLQFMKLAKGVARGKAVRERCDGNIRIIQAVLDDLPTEEMGAEGQEVYRLLKETKQQKTDLSIVRTLLLKARPLLKALKKRLGKTNAAYLKLSTLVVKHVLRDIVEVLNDAFDELSRIKKQETKGLFDMRLAFLIDSQWSASYRKARSRVMRRLEEVWPIIRKLEFYDMEDSFRQNSYNKQRSEIEKICEKAFLKTRYFSDTVRRHPTFFCVLIGVLLLLLTVLPIIRDYDEREQQMEREQLNELISNAVTKKDWQQVIETAKTCRLSSYRSEALQKARKEIDEIDWLQEEANERQEKKTSLLTQYQQAISLYDLESFVSEASDYLEKYESDGDNYIISQRKQEAQKRIEEEEANERQEKKASLLTQYQHAISLNDFERFISEASDYLEKYGSDGIISQRKQEAQKFIEDVHWGTEADAWATVQREDTLDACRAYLSRYPQGQHAEQANKRIIDAEVNGVFASGEYGQLPATERTSYSISSTVNITITNNTEYTLTILYSGPSSKKLEIPSHGTRSVELPVATYKIVASVNSSRVRPFAGTETYNGGRYEVTYYISTNVLPLLIDTSSPSW